VQSDQTPAAIRERLKSLLGSDDQLLVIDIFGDTAAWFRVDEAGSFWPKNNV
jgi:hypothetical protein